MSTEIDSRPNAHNIVNLAEEQREILKRHGSELVEQHQAKRDTDVQVGQSKGRDGQTLLHWAIENDYVEMADVLLRIGWDVEVDKNDHDRRTALHIAAMKGYEAVVHRLLKTGANIESKDKDGRTRTEGQRCIWRPWRDTKL
jgi:hypothetical protein